MARAREITGIVPEARFGEAAASAVATRAEEVFEFADRVLDTGDIEGLHAMRVATRRLRAALEVYAPAFPRKAHAAALAEVKALAGDLGVRRDLDVAIKTLGEIESGFHTADRPGVEHLIEALAKRQSAANELIAARLTEIERNELQARLRDLSEMARGSRRPAE
ncbi:MAG: CHAD domain-containing protein [Thermoleophilaceae bacterium]|nr:CHAD domain-containing protein [Thermoleophilaceae bacterium]